MLIVDCRLVHVNQRTLGSLIPFIKFDSLLFWHHAIGVHIKASNITNNSVDLVKDYTLF